eukprot:4336215-Prymnesium_polylepis.1
MMCCSSASGSTSICLATLLYGERVPAVVEIYRPGRTAATPSVLSITWSHLWARHMGRHAHRADDTDHGELASGAVRRARLIL